MKLPGTAAAGTLSNAYAIVGVAAVHGRCYHSNKLSLSLRELGRRLSISDEQAWPLAFDLVVSGKGKATSAEGGEMKLIIDPYGEPPVEQPTDCAPAREDSNFDSLAHMFDDDEARDVFARQHLDPMEIAGAGFLTKGVDALGRIEIGLDELTRKLNVASSLIWSALLPLGRQCGLTVQRSPAGAILVIIASPTADARANGKKAAAPVNDKKILDAIEKLQRANLHSVTRRMISSEAGIPFGSMHHMLARLETSGKIVASFDGRALTYTLPLT